MDGVTFNPNVVNHQAQLGTYEKWMIDNASPYAHFFHIHQTDFQVTVANNATQSFHGYQDTLTLLPFSKSEIIIPFIDPNMVGKFMVHCHILEHEDAGMMQIIEVLPQVNTPASASLIVISLALQFFVILFVH